MSGRRAKDDLQKKCSGMLHNPMRPLDSISCEEEVIYQKYYMNKIRPRREAGQVRIVFHNLYDCQSKTKSRYRHQECLQRDN